MNQILYSAIGTLIIILLHDLTVISSRLIIRKREQKQQTEILQTMKMYREKFNEWKEQYKPENYGDEQEFTLQICHHCEKLKKNIIQEEDGNICLDCKVEA